MPQKGNPKTPPLTDIRNSQCKMLSGSLLSRAVGIGASGRVLAIGRFGSRVAPGLGCKSIMFVGPAAQAVGWPMVGGVARRSWVVAWRGAGLRAERQSSFSGRPPWSAWAGLGCGQGGRQGFVGGRSTVLQGTGMFRVLGELHLAPRSWLMHNPSLKRSAIGRPPVPGLLHAKHSHRPGPVVPPPSSA